MHGKPPEIIICEKDVDKSGSDGGSGDENQWLHIGNNKLEPI